ncbi:heavy metal sensor histidine kinase [Sulfurirhabdus autotrophica]|uniref:Sensor protein n=1 Tax=Sulfurirhabdus autotrophica TaxID=1706046 RepID=A0A4V2W316_9PROT|nr:heavy metal sensor histidine kinase [Sulfurirhabdus autotrophica]TCV90259.1 two-component system heavy metal sensor histidine kinase CusS [Sulfurirhabdus autotrophica]
MIPRISITARLTFFFAVTSAIIMISVGIVLDWAMEKHFKQLDVVEINGKLELIRHAINEKLPPESNNSLSLRLSDALIGHHALSVKVLKPGGIELLNLGEADFPDTLMQDPVETNAVNRDMLRTWHEGDNTFHGVAVALSSGQPGLPFIVALGTSTEQHQAFINLFQQTLMIAVALGILLSSILAWLVSHKGLEPLRKIARIAEGISAEKLHNRLPVEVVPIELTNLATALNQMLSRLEESFHRLSDFSSDIAHEIRTPVSNLMTVTNVALTKARSAEEYREILYSNLEEYQRLSRMIDDMLFLAKADNGLLIPHNEAVDLASEIQGLFTFYEALAEEKHLALTSEGQGVIQGDRLMLQRALSNLLSNAIRHTPSGGKIRIDLLSEVPGVAVVNIENTGNPIPFKYLPRIFDRFYRVDPSRQRSSDGAGLGLAITKSIIEAHDGHITATSDDDKTLFTIQLPLKRKK